MITEKQIEAMEIDDTQIQADIDDYEDFTLQELSQLIRKFKNRIVKIEKHLEKTYNKKQFDYSVMYEDIERYSKKYGAYDADIGVRKKVISTIEKHLKPAIEHLQLLKQTAFDGNRVKQLEYLKRKVECDCGKQISYVHLAAHKLSKSHQLDNHITEEQKLENRQKAFEVNRVKHLEYMTRKVECECGLEVSYAHLQRHKQSLKHIQTYMKKLKDEPCS